MWLNYFLMNSNKAKTSVKMAKLNQTLYKQHSFQFI